MCAEDCRGVSLKSGVLMVCDAGESAGGVEHDVVAVVAVEILRSMPGKLDSVCADGEGMGGEVGEKWLLLFVIRGAM